MSLGPDAVVVGAGHNGLVAANLLADAGWDVLVLEAAEHPGGAVWSDRGLHPDFVTDWFSAFYPVAAASPVFAALDLARWGLSWRHAPAVLAHVFPDDRCALLARDATRTASSLDAFAVGDGDAWLELVDTFERIRTPVLRALFTPFPPVRAGLSLARALRTSGLLRFARFGVLPVRRFGEEQFRGAGGPALLAGSALHTDLPPEAAGSAIYGWLLCMLGQSSGFPVPKGGSAAIIDALATRLRASGGEIRTSAPVTAIEVDDGRATGVRLASGEHIRTQAVLADVSAPNLYGDLLRIEQLPARMRTDLRRFQWDYPTLKLNWALSGPIPWTAPDAREAGTVHLGTDVDGLTFYAAALAARRLPTEPFLLLGQMTTADLSRSPAGTESAWAYTHLPAGAQDLPADEIAQHVDRMEAAVERNAPGFRDLVLARSVQSPADLQDADGNLVAGAVGGGTSALYQQLVFRPVPGLGGAATPIDGVYLASASAHPGGGVHGGPGANAARAALARRGALGPVRRRLTDVAFRRIYRSDNG